MTDYYWAAAAAGNASVDSNWSPVGVPGSGDTVIFTSANSIKDCTMNITEVTTLTMQRTYTGTITLDNGFTVSGDLTITAGTVDTGADHDLTVGGTLSLMPERDGGGTDPDANLICNGSDITAYRFESWGVWDSGGYSPKCVFTGGTGDHEYGKLAFMVGTNAVLSSGITEITDAGGGAFRCDINPTYNSYDNGDGTVKFTSSSDQLLYSTSQEASDYNLFYDLILEKTTSTLQGMTTVGFHIKVENDLTITSGILNTTTTNDTDHDLTVGGVTTIDGTLITNASDVSLGSGYADAFALNGGGTMDFGTGDITIGASNVTSSSITKTSGTVTFDSQKTGGQFFGPNMTAYGVHLSFGTSTVNLGPLTNGTNIGIEQHSGTDKTLTITADSVNYKNNGYIYQNSTDNNKLKIIGDLVIDASKTVTTFYDSGDDYGSLLEVTGDVTLNGKLSANSSANPKTMTFGSITIGGAGEYDATSGTTSLTFGASSGTWVLQNGGTFTHNNGTIKVTSTEGVCHIQSNTFYNVTVAMGDSTDATKWRDAGGNTTTILGDLVIEEGMFKRDSNGDDLIVHGLVDVQSGGTFGTASESGDNTFNSLTIGSAGTYNSTSASTTIAGNLINNGGNIY